MTICWHKPYGFRENGTRCWDSHRDDLLFYWGRCPSGRRWFWVAGDLDDFADERPTHGWEETEEEAGVAARATVERLAAGRPAAAHVAHKWARNHLKKLNAQKRRARPAAKSSESKTVEYLYGVSRGTEGWDGPGTGSPAEVVPFQIAKKTPKRVYYLRRYGWPGEEPEIGYVDRQKIEAEGEIYNQGVHWCQDDWHLYLKPPELYQLPAGPDPRELKRLKREMADAHPDRGGSNETFIAARHRYVAARAKAGVPS